MAVQKRKRVANFNTGKDDTGQRSLCTVTTQAVARARVDDRSVERSICVTCSSVCVGTNHRYKPHALCTCTCLRVCEQHTFQPSQQSLRHSRAATENFKRHKVQATSTVGGYRRSPPEGPAPAILHDLRMRDLWTGQPRDKRSF